VLFSHGPNEAFLVPDSCRAIERTGNSISADVTYSLCFIYVICVYLLIALSNTYCIVFFALFVFILFLVCPMLPDSLDRPSQIAPSVFSNV